MMVMVIVPMCNSEHSVVHWALYFALIYYCTIRYYKLQTSELIRVRACQGSCHLSARFEFDARCHHPTTGHSL